VTFILVLHLQFLSEKEVDGSVNADVNVKNFAISIISINVILLTVNYR